MYARVRIAGLALIAALALVVAGCGGGGDDNGSTSGGGAGGGQEGGSISVLMGTAPDYLDPQLGYTTQSAEATWISYTPLVTYRHATGEAGGELIPGLATALPEVSRDGLTYTLTLRRGLRFSDGRPVRASDFAYTIQRAIRLNWGGKSFYTNYIEGAADYDARRADAISGIQTDDATGRIAITLTEPYGAFGNVLAFPSSGLVPSGTPMRNLSNDPPPGVGPYMITNVSPNRGFTVERSPSFASLDIPDIPTGHLDTIRVTIVSNTQSEAQRVLNNEDDVFDAGDTLPPSILPQIESQASDRFSREAVPSTYYFLLNVTKPPFDDLRARQAVNYAIDRDAMVRLASGFLEPSCWFIPEGLVGNPATELPDVRCPYGERPDIAKARALIREAGLVGTRVVVWGQQRSPRREYVDYWTDLLNEIGFDASERIIADEVYFPTIGSAETDPQTGFADWIQDFPNPADFYLLMDGRSIQPTNNQNFSKVNDPFIQRELNRLNKVPTAELESVAEDWARLDVYTARRAYVAAYGAELHPKFYSDRIDFDAAIFHPTYLNDWTSLRLK
ncbi:MAG TPA: ABC transporter substrate-binding protein [Gemmatimonadaceae bacterium]|nr:ABC transporter substrate-binding protein [Gemmatimonadaceae bacterium]